MPRQLTGPYRRGIDLLPEYRNCDRCRVRVLRTAGSYVKTSPLTQVWCCDHCQIKAKARRPQAQEGAQACQATT